MFLVCFPIHLHIIKCILQFIENHSVLVGVVTSVVVSSLWLKKFLRQKRAEAFLGFYAKLSLRLKTLCTLLEEHNLLNICDSEKGNIYSLIYAESCIETVCPSFSPPNDDEIRLYQQAAKELKCILIETDNNVYPLNANRKKWYDSQYILFSFCEYLENLNQFQNKVNKPKAENETNVRHFVKCKQLVEAVNYIQNSIDNAKY